MRPKGYRPAAAAKDNARTKVQRVVFSEDLVVSDEASFNVSCLFTVVLLLQNITMNIQSVINLT